MAAPLLAAQHGHNPPMRSSLNARPLSIADDLVL